MLMHKSGTSLGASGLTGKILRSPRRRITIHRWAVVQLFQMLLFGFWKFHGRVNPRPNEKAN
jgi:hypothetical protein